MDRRDDALRAAVKRQRGYLAGSMPPDYRPPGEVALGFADPPYPGGSLGWWLDYRRVLEAGAATIGERL